MKIKRRAVLRQIGSWIGVSTAAGPLGLLSGCGGGASVAANPSSPVLPPPPDDPATVLGRLKIALRQAIPPTVGALAMNVSQGAVNSADPVGGEGAAIYPAPQGFLINPNPVSWAELPQVWGHRRDTWTQQTAVYFNSVTQNASWFVPVTRLHSAQTQDSRMPAVVHFLFTGQAFEVLFAGHSPQITLIADGEYCAARFINTTLANGVRGQFLTGSNTATRFDFGTRATRRISLYAQSSIGPCAIVVGAQDDIQPWDRSAEPSFFAMTDSYGQAGALNWCFGGPFWEAAAVLGIPHLDLHPMGGTGYAPNNTNADTRLAGNAFGARLAGSVTAAPDLFLTAGGINDNNSFAAPPLYASADEALAAFNEAVGAYFRNLRAALPDAVLAAMGPWAPVEFTPPHPVAQSKLDTIRSSLQAVGGPWVFVDNLNGGWLNSSGASTPPTGRGWQTGTGNVGAPRGDGNGDWYVSADGTHPTTAGCVYLAQMLAANLKAAILAL